MAATWLPAHGHSDYLVSTDGQVYSLLRRDGIGRVVGGNLLTPVKRGKKNYLYVNLGGRMVAIHRLMLETFIRPAKSSRELARHHNDVADDNRLENLSWGTYADNAADRRRNGGYAKKAKCVNGHEYTSENTWLTREGWQQCRTCHRDRARKT
ncbi:HNH endonuclease [Mycobacterium phage Enceladus]|uniref:HNH endonuclease n=3 Tax=Bronvirus TaxID=1623278 RepID=G1BQJ3_9CAUD|nr:HNH endonuclease [Mycobacterium phage JoeDirt]AEK07599.1 hypothetical protein UPIE_65 [Mycobacterium phage UPIE]AEZ50742.1 hypothetical protein [Mycobacterium phage Fezzik]AYD82244.1 hypothetical protein SEA_WAMBURGRXPRESS_65 [Mycobacterium phage Wamburgrxpress]QWT30593.1 HNH endonuclease [Mycobacterium phage Rose5]UEM46349.1 HNH endonuclease [Mycobacterium phage Enceladus]